MTDEYEVGYRKPPRHTRFRKGQSGNPRGRPKRVRNLKTELEEELRETITVREGGTRKAVSKQRAMLKSLTAKAMQGDLKATGLIVDMVYRLCHDGGPEEDEALADADALIIERYGERIRHTAQHQAAATDPDPKAPEEAPE